MTLTEAFEGENSSLRKTFDEVVARESKDTWREELYKILSESGMTYSEISLLIEQEIDKAVKEEREKIVNIVSHHYIVGHAVVTPMLESIINKINNLK